jgi:hypothetical protein
MRTGLTKRALAAAAVTLAAGLTCSAVQATPIPLGDIQWDVIIPGSFGEFDIVNETGPNSGGAFPVSTEVQFNSLSLVVHFSDGSTTTFGPSYFTLNADGESLDGSPIAIGGTSPVPTEAILTGDLTPTTIVMSGTPTTVNSAFDTATITPSSPPNLADGDFAIIDAETGVTPPPPVPEPDMAWTLPVVSFIALIFAHRRGRRRDSQKIASAARLGGAIGAVFGVVGILFPAVSFASTTLVQNTASNPGSGVAGVTFLNITASGFPSGPINPANVTIRLAPTCPVGAAGPIAGEADATATSVQPILGSSDRVHFELPSTLLSGAPVTPGTYLAQIVDSTDNFSGANCSIVVVKTTQVFNACVPTSSLAVTTGTTVTAYVPNGYWDGGNAGIQAVPIEGGGSPSSISTPNVVNSCAGNPVTGQVVCTANNTDVYLISGNSLTKTLTGGQTGRASFSGGECQNCGVAINALTNTAAISGGGNTGSLGHGVQILNLNTNTFQPVFNTHAEVSEDISIDPGRSLILSPNEQDNYMILSLNPTTGAITSEFDRSISTIGGGEPDSAAEDCSTGIALSSVEIRTAGVVTDQIFLQDLSQATFTPGAPGSYTAPSALFNLTNTVNLSFGTNGISVAQGMSHLGIVEGEFGGNTFVVFELPATSGTGGASPTILDYVGATLPPTPDGSAFSAGCDPHTVTVYTSPNNGVSFGVIAGDEPACSVSGGGTPAWLAVIDLAKVLSANRTTGTHTIAPSVNLIATGILRYVATH